MNAPRHIRPIKYCSARTAGARDRSANFILIREGELLTRSLDSTFLHGVTRDSLLTLT